jgi:very-short-patch-repair endonuclease
MRRQPTFTEAWLWTLLRGRALKELKFRRQVPIGTYIADFACYEHRIIVEADGRIHDAPFYDRVAQATRDAWFKEAGYTVLRVSNAEAEDRPQIIIARILACVSAP